MITVHYKDIGRDKKSWSTQFKKASESVIASEAKRNGGLMSSDVDALLSDNGSTGHIIVGGWRAVGVFTITTP